MKKKTAWAVSALFVSLAAMPAQSQPDKLKDPPKITAEMRETFFQAKSDLLEAQVKLTDAQKRLDASLKEMQAVCPLTLDAQGKPQCSQPAPEATKTPEKK